MVSECRALVLLAAGLLSDKFRDDNDRESRYRDAESVRKKYAQLGYARQVLASVEGRRLAATCLLAMIDPPKK